MKWVYLYSPMHTGTHFMRLLLELHPNIGFWKTCRSQVNGRQLLEWRKLHQAGVISWSQLVALTREAPETDPGWSHAKLEGLGFDVLPKRPVYDLVQTHSHMQRTYYPVPTVVSLRDPLLAIITGLRLGGPRRAEQVLAGFESLVAFNPCQYLVVPVDLCEADRSRMLAVFAYLGLPLTKQIRRYIEMWPHPNNTAARVNKVADTRPALVEARTMTIRREGIHPAVTYWATQLAARQALQPFLEHHGYRDLVWFR